MTIANHADLVSLATRPLLRLVLLTLVMLLPVAANAAVSVSSNWYVLNAEFEYLEDPSGEITIDDLLSRPDEFVFHSSGETKPALVFAPVWLKLSLSFTEEARAKEYLLVARSENIAELRVYRQAADGAYFEKVTGNDHPADTRELNRPRYAFHVPKGSESTTIYIRKVGGPGSTNLAWDLVEESFFTTGEQRYYLITVACLAAILALCLFNFLIAVSLWRLEYLYYSGGVFFVALSLITMEGEGFRLLWPQLPQFNDRALHTFVLCATILQLLSVNAFFGLTQHKPLLQRCSQAAIGCMLAGILLVNIFGMSKLPPLVPWLPWVMGTATLYLFCLYAVMMRIKLAVPLLICMLIPKITASIQALLILHSPTLGVAEMQLAKIGFTVHVLLFSTCLAAHIKHEAQARSQALHDGLTGLPGKQLLHERFEWMKRIALRENQVLTVLFIDLDRFKSVNDSLGHDAGDELLRQAAVRMLEQLRDADFLSRIGGDEFVVVLANDAEINASAIVRKRLGACLARPFELTRGTAAISGSIGLASASARDARLDTLLKAADTDMYRNKNRNRSGHKLAASLALS
ncbi:MAG: hypothetical protein Hals2KO_33080 [Halioglobus sp.]